MTSVAEMLAGQVADLPRLRAAMLLRDTTTNMVGFITGRGAPSYELISLGVEALLADMRREVDECERALRADLGHNWHRSPRLADALERLGGAYDGGLRTLPAGTGSVDRAERRIVSWYWRTRMLLGEAWAPYALKWQDGTPVICPLDAELLPGMPWKCTGVLCVYRDRDTGVPNEIRCSEVPAHSWPKGPGVWLRLGALLGCAA